MDTKKVSLTFEGAALKYLRKVTAITGTETHAMTAVIALQLLEHLVLKQRAGVEMYFKNGNELQSFTIKDVK